MRKLIIAIQVRLFQAWCTSTEPKGHPREVLLYHGYQAAGRLQNAARPK